jgi:hypothetical protein
MERQRIATATKRMRSRVSQAPLRRMLYARFIAASLE